MNASWADCWWLPKKASRQHTENATEFIDFGPVSVRYQLLGQGPPLVVIPDPPNMIEHHRRLTADLARDHRVLCFDPPGFGFSFPKRGFRFTLDEQADLLIALIETCELQGCTLSVCCLGALAGLIAASRRPDLISKLVLMQVASYEQMRAWSFKEDVFRIIQTPLLGQLAMRWGKRLVAHQWYRSALPPNVEPDPFLTPTLDAFRNGACFGLASSFQAVQRGRFALDGPIQQPTVVLWGTADATHSQTCFSSIREHVPHAQLLEYPQCGHFPDLENEGAYRELIRSFVNRDA